MIGAFSGRQFGQLANKLRVGGKWTRQKSANAPLEAVKSVGWPRGRWKAPGRLGSKLLTQALAAKLRKAWEMVEKGLRKGGESVRKA